MSGDSVVGRIRCKVYNGKYQYFHVAGNQQYHVNKSPAQLKVILIG